MADDKSLSEALDRIFLRLAREGRHANDEDKAAGSSVGAGGARHNQRGSREARAGETPSAHVEKENREHDPSRGSGSNSSNTLLSNKLIPPLPQRSRTAPKPSSVLFGGNNVLPPTATGRSGSPHHLPSMGNTQKTNSSASSSLPQLTSVAPLSTASTAAGGGGGAVATVATSASGTFAVGKTRPPPPKMGLPAIRQRPKGHTQREDKEEAAENESHQLGSIHNDDEAGFDDELDYDGRRGVSPRSSSVTTATTRATARSNAPAAPTPTGFWLEQIQKKFEKKRIQLHEKEANNRIEIIEEEIEAYEQDLLATWVKVRQASNTERKAKENAQYEAAARRNQENRLMYALMDGEVRHVRNAIRAEYESGFDELVCYCRAVINTAEQKAQHAAQMAERRVAEKKARETSDALNEATKKKWLVERARALVIDAEKENRLFIQKLESAAITAMADVFRARRKVLSEQEASVQSFWARHRKRQTHLQHSMDWLIAEETSKREANAKAERQRFDLILNAYPESYKGALQSQVVRQKGEARERLEVEDQCKKERDQIELEYAQLLASLKVIENEERAKTQAIIDRAIQLASRRAMADAFAAREREKMFIADNESWHAVRLDFENSLDFIAIREEAHARAELALWKAAEKAFVLALLRQRTNLSNAAQRSRRLIEAECDAGYDAITEELQASQDRFLLQWFESIKRRMIEDEYEEASGVFASHARTLSVSANAFASVRRSAADKPHTNGRSRFAVQLRRNAVPWFFGADGCKFLDQATIRSAAVPGLPLSKVEELDVTLEILNPHEGDTLEYIPAVATHMARRSSFLPANYLTMIQQQQQQREGGANGGGPLPQRNATSPSAAKKSRSAASVGRALSNAGTVRSMSVFGAGDSPSKRKGGDDFSIADDNDDASSEWNSAGPLMADGMSTAFGEMVDEDAGGDGDEDGDDDPLLLGKRPVEIHRRINIRRYTGEVRQLLDGISFRNVQPFNKLRVMHRAIRVNIDTITLHIFINVLPAVFTVPSVAVTTNVAAPLANYTAPPHREYKKLRCVLALEKESPDNVLNFKLPNAYFNHPKNGILLNGRQIMRINAKTNAMIDIEFDNVPTVDVRPLLASIKVNRKEGALPLKPLSLTLLVTLRDESVLALHQQLDVDNARLDAPKLRVHSLDLPCRVSIADAPVTKANEELIDDLPFSFLSRTSVRFPDLQTQFCGGTLSLTIENDPEGNVGLCIRPISSERYAFEVVDGVLWAIDNHFYKYKSLSSAALKVGDAEDTNDSYPTSARSTGRASTRAPPALMEFSMEAAGSQPVSPRGARGDHTARSAKVEDGQINAALALPPPRFVRVNTQNSLLTTQAAIKAAGAVTSVHGRRFAIGYALYTSVAPTNAFAAATEEEGSATADLLRGDAANGESTEAGKEPSWAAVTTAASIGQKEITIKFNEDTFFDVELIDPLLRAVGFMYRRGAAPLPIPTSSKEKDKDKSYKLHMRLDVRTNQTLDPIDVTFRVGVLPCLIDIKNDALNYREGTGFKALPTMSIKPASYSCSHEARIVLEMVDGIDEDLSDEVTVMDCEPDPKNPQQMLLINSGQAIAAVIRHANSKVEAMLLPTNAPWRRTHIGQPYPREAFHNGEVNASAFNAVLRSLAFQSTSNDAQYLKKILKLTVDDGISGPTSALVQVTIESVDDPTDIILATPEVTYRQLSRGLALRGCPLMPGVRLEDVDSDNFHGGYISIEYATGPSTDMFDDLVVLTSEQQEITIHQPEDTSMYSSLYAILGSASEAQIAEAIELQAVNQLGSSLPRPGSLSGGRGSGVGGLFFGSPPDRDRDLSVGGGSPSGMHSPHLSPSTARGGPTVIATLGTGRGLTVEAAALAADVSSASVNPALAAAPYEAGLEAAASMVGGFGGGFSGLMAPFPCLALVAEMAPQKSFAVKDNRMYFCGSLIGTVSNKRGANSNITTLTLLFRSESKFVSFPAAEYAMRCIGYENAHPRIIAGVRQYTVRLNCTGLKSTAETVVKVGVNVVPSMIFVPPYASSVRFEGDKPRPLLKSAIVTMPDAAAVGGGATSGADGGTSIALGSTAVLSNQGFLKLRVVNTDDLNDEILIDESLGEGVKLKEKAVIVGRDTVASIVPLVNINVNSGLPKPNYLHLSFVKMTAEGLEAVLKSICFSYKNSVNKDMQNLRSRTIELEFSPTNSDPQSVCYTQITVEMSRKDVPYAITLPMKSLSRRLAFVQGSVSPLRLLSADCNVTDAKGRGFLSGWVLEAFSSNANSTSPSSGGPSGRRNGAGAASGEYFVVSTLSLGSPSTLAIRCATLSALLSAYSSPSSLAEAPPAPLTPFAATYSANTPRTTQPQQPQQQYCFTIVDTGIGTGEVPIASFFGAPMVNLAHLLGDGGGGGDRGGGLVPYSTYVNLVVQQQLVMSAQPLAQNQIGGGVSPRRKEEKQFSSTGRDGPRRGSDSSSSAVSRPLTPPLSSSVVKAGVRGDSPIMSGARSASPIGSASTSKPPLLPTATASLGSALRSLLASPPPLHFAANGASTGTNSGGGGARSLFLMLEKTLSAPELKDVLGCVGYVNNSKLDRDSSKNVSIMLHRPRGPAGGGTSSNANSPSNYMYNSINNANASTTTAIGLSLGSGSANSPTKLLGAAVLAFSGGGSSELIPTSSSPSSSSSNSPSSIISSSFIPLIRLDLSVKVIRPMLDMSLTPSTISFPWAGVAMGDAEPAVTVAAGARCEIPPEAGEVLLSVVIITADTLLLGRGGESLAGLINSSSEVASGSATISPRVAATVNKGGGIRRGSSAAFAQQPAGSGQFSRTSTNIITTANAATAALPNTTASRGVTWAMAGRRSSSGGGSSGGAGATEGTSRKQQPRSGDNNSTSQDDIVNNNYNTKGSISAKVAAASAILEAYDLVLEWKPPMDNPLGIALDMSTGKIYYGVGSSHSTGTFASAISSSNAKAAGVVGLARAGSLPTSPSAATLASSVAVGGNTSTRGGTLFGTLSIRSDAVTISHEPATSGAACDSLIAQAVLRCVRLVARNVDGSGSASFAIPNAGTSAVVEVDDKTKMSRERGRGGERVAVPIVVSLSSSIGQNRAILSVEV